MVHVERLLTDDLLTLPGLLKKGLLVSKCFKKKMFNSKKKLTSKQYVCVATGGVSIHTQHVFAHLKA